MALAAWARDRLAATVVGITGSVGKTSTKDLVRAAARGRPPRGGERAQLQQRAGPARHDPRGARRHRGARARDGDARASARSPASARSGDRRSASSRPSPPSHTETLGGIDGVARAKGELVEALPAVGHRDPQRRRRAGARRWAPAPLPAVLTYGQARDADVRIDGLALDGLRPPSVHGAHAVGDRRGRARRPRRPHGGQRSGGDRRRRRARRRARRRPPTALVARRVSAMRMQVVPAASGGIVVNDAYNANPTSMAAALDVARRGARPTRRVAVLGAMAELDDPGGGPPCDRRAGRASSASS